MVTGQRAFKGSSFQKHFPSILHEGREFSLESPRQEQGSMEKVGGSSLWPKDQNLTCLEIFYTLFLAYIPASRYPLHKQTALTVDIEKEIKADAFWSLSGADKTHDVSVWLKTGLLLPVPIELQCVIACTHGIACVCICVHERKSVYVCLSQQLGWSTQLRMGGGERHTNTSFNLGSPGTASSEAAAAWTLEACLQVSGLYWTCTIASSLLVFPMVDHS